MTPVRPVIYSLTTAAPYLPIDIAHEKHPRSRLVVISLNDTLEGICFIFGEMYCDASERIGRHCYTLGLPLVNAQRGAVFHFSIIFAAFHLSGEMIVVW